MESLLKSGLFLDALDLSFKSSKREIIGRILDIKENKDYDQEFHELMLSAKEYLTIKRELYENGILPCIDYIFALFEYNYGTEIREKILDLCIFKFDLINIFALLV